MARAQVGRVGRLSPHFDAAEFACPHCHVALVRDELLSLLERLRARVGKPLHIVSGYRCPVHNAAIDGATDSMHMYGAASDLLPGLVSSAMARSSGAKGIGTAGAWAVHVDVRDGPVTTWRYS